MKGERAAAVEIIGPDRFIEVYLSSGVSVCEQRDSKGLYAKARAGQIPEFTGISAPYEPPVAPDLTIDTGGSTVGESVAALFDFLSDRLPIFQLLPAECRPIQRLRRSRR